jgi:hypothetical protein
VKTPVLSGPQVLLLTTFRPDRPEVIRTGFQHVARIGGDNGAIYCQVGTLKALLRLQVIEPAGDAYTYRLTAAGVRGRAHHLGERR